jgi:hypothetical protein
MSLILSKVLRRTKYAGGFIVASVIGGVISVSVLAAVPSSTGTVSACYNKTSGAVKVIDTEAGKTCTSKENPLILSGINTSSPLVYDANGQAIGSTVGYNPDPNTENGEYNYLYVYNPTLDRVLTITNTHNSSGTLVASIGETVGAWFVSSDCSGQSYVETDAGSGPGLGSNLLKTTLLQWQSSSTSSYVYGVVAASALASTLTVNSVLSGGSCVQQSSALSLYPLTSATLPFTHTVTPPFAFTQ